ncbi:MAG: DUF2975 domain-containing protein [Flavobacterium sp.]|nr:MAG: DUF2975 domain-containing protein [Flavobacterium sp.]
MNIKIGTQQILTILYVLSWIIFIGLCVEAGIFIFSGIFTLAISSYTANYLDLVSLYNLNSAYYIQEIILISIPAVMKAIMFYLIVKILHDKKLNMTQPFNRETGRFIFNLSYLAIGIGLFSYWGANFTKWLITQEVKMPALETLRLEGADVWLFMGIILIVIAQIFKRGIEIQSENELTI